MYNSGSKTGNQTVVRESFDPVPGTNVSATIIRTATPNQNSHVWYSGIGVGGFALTVFGSQRNVLSNKAKSMG